ncbi:putative arginyl-tRNA--protein transferase [Neiella marina]|uniref:Aspartate/glutamate leucyltransferase n=1 Tax=Neiella marina TaxID=508461 RepID=A0A8J2U2V0_9GAMM|nr:arginyltransferase [Neiella marina]GGA68712.1 putative arginyl-tRNA--protein transferase [Neiella marina]
MSSDPWKHDQRARLALSQPSSCSYIPGNEEQLLFVLDQRVMNEYGYDYLLAHGFRRSGMDVYRPHCANCNACQSLRIAVADFTPSKSQKRVIAKSKSYQWLVTDDVSDEHFALYSRYIEQRHRNGTMYPPDRQQLIQFGRCDWLSVLHLECWYQDQLVAVAITDETPNGLSALYTYFAPELAHRSLGSACILQQIELAKAIGKKYLYLGYQIDACQAMNYKTKFQPNEKFIDGKWRMSKKSAT